MPGHCLQLTSSFNLVMLCLFWTDRRRSHLDKSWVHFHGEKNSSTAWKQTMLCIRLQCAAMLRRFMVNQSVNGSMRREGFEKDITAIASVASKHFDDFANGVLEEKSKLPAPVQTALRNLMFSTAVTPLTDGHKQRLRHMGHNQNIIWGPLQTFSTHNFADTYCVLLNMLCTGDFELPQDEEPVMPTLQEMHRMAAASTASTPTLWLLK